MSEAWYLRRLKARLDLSMITKEECREQIQEDVRAYVEALYAYDDDEGEAQELCDHLCQIVVDNFKKLEADA